MMNDACKMWVGGVACAALLGGCSFGIDEQAPPAPTRRDEPTTRDESTSEPADAGPPTPAPTTGEPLLVAEPTLEGKLGDVSEFGDEVWTTDAVGTSSGADVDIYGRDVDEDWTVMTRLAVQGDDLDAPELQPGTTHRFGSWEPDADFHVQVLGCSGPATGSWTYDEYADEVEVTVLEGSAPGWRRIEYTAHFERYGEQQTVDAAFEVSLED